MKFLHSILRSNRGKLVIAGLFLYAIWQVYLGLPASSKVDASLRDGKSKVNVQVILPFTPDRFHVMAMQQFGRVSGTEDTSIEVRGVKQDDLSSLARPFLGEADRTTKRRLKMLLKKFLLCLCLLAPGLTIGQNLVKMKAGMVAGIDQIGLPIALERGFFEKWGLDVTISRPYATGVDALNSLQAGENDILQVGVPMIGAVLRGMDLVALGNYSGSAHKLGGDATIALIAGSTSGILKGDLKTLKGKKIAASFGTINHLYVLGLLEKAGLTPADLTLVNTPPPDMTVALLAKGIDAFACWDPVPIIALRDVPGAVEIIRGGDVISYVGFNVALRPWVEKNGATIEKFLAAVSEADQWMRANPKAAAQVATRWIPGLKQDVAETAMQFNIQQADRRLSTNNYKALWSAEDRLNRLGFIKSTFDVNKHIEPKHMLNVVKDHPRLFSDLPAIPANVMITPGYVFKP